MSFPLFVLLVKCAAPSEDVKGKVDSKQDCSLLKKYPHLLSIFTKEKVLSHEFRSNYKSIHDSEYMKEYFQFICHMMKFMKTIEEVEDFKLNIYALEAEIHNNSPTSTDNCLKQHVIQSMGQ